jgi:hypothetical protein
MIPRTLAAFAAALLLPAAPQSGPVSKRVVRFDAKKESLLKEDAWRPYEKGFERDGRRFACDNGSDPKAARGVSQTVVLNQKVPLPIVATAWSRAEGVTGSADSDYSIYLDLAYMDGEPLYGQTAAFSAGTHDWERREVRVLPARPVRSVSFYLLLRRHGGKAWFRDPELRQVEVPLGAALFDGLLVSPGGKSGGFAARDAAADSDFVAFEGGRALGLRLDTETSAAGRATFHQARLADAAGKDRAVTLVFAFPVPAGEWRWLADPRREEAAEAPREYYDTVRYSAGSDGRLSRWPLAAVARGKEGYAIGIDLGRAAYYRVGFSAAFRELYIAFDLGLAPERNAAEVRLCTFPFDAAWGMRGALAAYNDLFPDYFRCRAAKQGVWMPFHKISQVEGWEDFGFRFKEGDNEVPWDDAHDIVTFRYTEPMTWWMKMAPGMPRTMEAALAEASRLAEKGDRSARAFLFSAFHDPNGRPSARLLDTPWCNGAVWSIDSSSGVPGEITDFKTKWSPETRDRLYGPNRKGDLDGEYVDSSEGYVTDELNFRRGHFASAMAPLTFSFQDRRPCVFRGLIAYDYVRSLAADVHGMGKLMMANSTPHGLCWLAPWLDVMGTETDWNPKGKWRPTPDRDLLWRRAVCGPKPYCFLMNTVFDEFPFALSEKFMKRSLAYGMFPGYFSHNASEGHYFSRKELYNRDRPLFRKYIPLCRKVAEAGWQPVTLARTGDPHVYVERFGRRVLTVFNDSAERKTVTVRLEGEKPEGAKELVRDAPLDVKDMAFTVTLEAEDVAVVELR